MPGILAPRRKPISRTQSERVACGRV